jgi:hypothetical protein
MVQISHGIEDKPRMDRCSRLMMIVLGSRRDSNGDRRSMKLMVIVTVNSSDS